MDLTSRVCAGLAATGLVLAVATWQPPRHDTKPAVIGATPVPAGLWCPEDGVLRLTPHGVVCADGGH